MIDVLNLKLRFVTDVLTERSGSLSEWSSFILLVENTCSTYPRLTDFTFLFNITWKGQLRDSPRLALVWLFHK